MTIVAIAVVVAVVLGAAVTYLLLRGRKPGQPAAPTEEEADEYAEAKKQCELALAADEQALGPEHPQVAADLCALAAALRELGELAEARQCYTRAIAILEKAPAEQRANLADALGELGDVLQEHSEEFEGEPGYKPMLLEAKGLHERALALDEAAFGPEHAKVAAHLNGLGGVLEDLGDLPAARGRYERALAINEKALGAKDPEVVYGAHNLGLFLKSMGDLPAAKAQLKRAARLAVDALGEDDETTQAIRESLEELDEE